MPVILILFSFNCLTDVLDKAAKEINAFVLCKKENQNTYRQTLSTSDKVIAFITASLSPEKIFLLHHATNERWHGSV